ncbi:MAG: hypothetical protein U0441_09810 [Polyangiaceae bacterium]
MAFMPSLHRAFSPRNAAFVAAALFGVAATGCASYVPFTYEMRSQHRLTDDEVKDLQFYTSHQITLRREVQSEDREITPGHKLRLISGKSVDEVVIPARTPGVALRVSKRVISVSFVDGTSLDFVTGTGRAPLGMLGDFAEPFAALEGTYRPRHKDSNPFQNPSAAAFLGQYATPPPGAGPVKIATPPVDPQPPVVPSYPYDEPTGSYFLTTDSSGRISFASRSWDAVDDTTQAHLLIRSDKLEETEERRTVLPGVRLGN